ncbi:MAG: IS30 family transposase [Thiolinea sp.]
MNKHYHQLTLEQRYQIWSLRGSRKSLRAIGEIVGVHHSTVSRELKRNRGDAGYAPRHAEQLSQTRKRTARKSGKRNEQIDNIIRDGLKAGWSPGSISERMKFELASPGDCLSHTSIYRMIAQDKARKGHLYLYLPNTGRTRWKGGKRQRQAGAGLIPERVDIKERPVIVESRQRLGDWEGDTVHGQSAHLVTLVERKSRFTLAKRVFSKTKQEVADAMIALLATVTAKVTLTLDNGGEFADHVRVGKAAKIAIFFARPYASWQRGTNENANGRIRRFWPKKFDMATLTEAEIEKKIWRLNMTPRKILGGKTPFEVFTGKRVALIS